MSAISGLQQKRTRPPLNVLGKRSYPLILIAKEKHATRRWIVSSDEEAVRLGLAIFKERCNPDYRYYPEFDSTQKYVADLQDELEVAEAALALAVEKPLDKYGLHRYEKQVAQLQGAVADYTNELNAASRVAAWEAMPPEAIDPVRLWEFLLYQRESHEYENISCYESDVVA